VVLQIDELKDIYIVESLQKSLGFNSIELICKISNLKLTTPKLIRDLKFYKDDEFFIFSNVRENFKAQYDIGSGVLNIKQEFKISEIIDKEYLQESITKAKEWIDLILEKSE
jgi:hypothetical protein